VIEGDTGITLHFDQICLWSNMSCWTSQLMMWFINIQYHMSIYFLRQLEDEPQISILLTICTNLSLALSLAMWSILRLFLLVLALPGGHSWTIDCVLICLGTLNSDWTQKMMMSLGISDNASGVWM
jgi:hypothetical protein